MTTARVGIIGAGLAGLAAARMLIGAGHEVLVIEKSRGVGGRIASRRVEGTVVDHGVPSIPFDPSGELAGVIRSLPGDDLVELRADRMAYRSGLTRLAKMLAGGVDLLAGIRIVALRAAAGGLELAGEQGNSHGVVDAVIVTAPAPQAADLLAHSPGGAERAAMLRTVEYEPAVMILAGLAIPEPAELEPFEVAAPFSRITAENVKGRPPVDGVVPVVARLAADASAGYLDASDAEILDATLPLLGSVCGARGEPSWVQVKRWRYAVPLRTIDVASVNPTGDPVIVCGDAVAPGGLDAAYRSGVAAARAVMRSPAGGG